MLIEDVSGANTRGKESPNEKDVFTSWKRNPLMKAMYPHTHTQHYTQSSKEAS